MMGTHESPAHFFSNLDEEMYKEAKFQHEINDKMRAPKRIKGTGEVSGEDSLLSNQANMVNSWSYHDPIYMHAPDRIVLLGHNEHCETRSDPREIQLENSILPKHSPNFVRVQTPPRTITLNDHHFPSASEESTPTKFDNYDNGDYEDDELRPPPYVRANNTSHAKIGFQPKDGANSIDSESQATTVGVSKSSHNHNLDNSIMSQRDGTPIGELTPHEEILYLRRQLAKLNRRVLNLEISNEQKIQREKIVYVFGIAYFVLKAIFWLNRN